MKFTFKMIDISLEILVTFKHSLHITST